MAQQFGSPLLHANLGSQGYYAQDTWKLRPNITLVGGLRYEWYGTPANQVQFPAVDPNNIDNYLAVVKEKADEGDFGPRFGFTYSPHFWRWLMGEDKTVIRGGFGIFFDGFFTNILDNTQSSSPNVVSPEIFNSLKGRGTANWSQQFSNLNHAPSPLGLQEAMVPHLLSPKTLQWNLNVQRELPGQFLGSVGYVGTRGEHLFGNDLINPLNPNTGFYRDPNRGFVIVRDNSGDSIYHGLIAELDRQAPHGLLFRASYTFSRAEDDVSEVFTAGTLSSFAEVQYPFPRKNIDWGLNDFDHRQRLALSYIYAIPKWNANQGAAKGLAALVNDWQIMGTTQFQSGNPENVEVGLDINGDGIGNDRPSLGNPKAQIQSYGVDGSYYRNEPAGTICDGPTFIYTNNPCLVVSPSSVHWIIPASGANGNVGRNSLITPGLEDWDFGIQRTFRIHESHQFDFRSEMFDVFNHGNTGTPDSFVTDGPPSGSTAVNHFLDYPLTVAGGRTVRFYMKYSF